HAFNLSSKYRVTPRWTLNFLFMYERYKESDWTVDNVTPSLANLVLNGFTTTTPADVRSVLLPILHPSYEAYFTAFSLAYTFGPGMREESRTREWSCWKLIGPKRRRLVVERGCVEKE